MSAWQRLIIGVPCRHLGLLGSRKVWKIDDGHSAGWPLLFVFRSCCRFALYSHVCHAADCFRRGASWYSLLYFVLTVTATRSSKAARPKRVNNAISARTLAALVIAFSWISSTKDVLLRSKSRSWI